MRPAVRFVPLTAELLAGAVLEERDSLTAEQARDPGFAAAFLDPAAVGGAMLGRGRVLAAAGLIPIWHGRAEAWLMLSPAASAAERAHALRHVQWQLDEAQRRPMFRRIEMHCRAEELWPMRLAALLRFNHEGLLRCWDARGRDYHLFARIAEARPA